MKLLVLLVLCAFAMGLDALRTVRRPHGRMPKVMGEKDDTPYDGNYWSAKPRAIKQWQKSRPFHQMGTGMEKCMREFKQCGMRSYGRSCNSKLACYDEKARCWQKPSLATVRSSWPPTQEVCKTRFAWCRRRVDSCEDKLNCYRRMLMCFKRRKPHPRPGPNTGPYYNHTSPYHKRARPYHKRVRPYHKRVRPYHNFTSPSYNHTGPYYNHTGPYYNHTGPYYNHTGPYYNHTRPYYNHTGPYYNHTGPYYNHTGPYYNHTGPYYNHTGPYYNHTGPYYNHTGPYYNHTGPYYNHTGPYYNHTGPYYNHTSPYYNHTRPYLNHTRPHHYRARPHHNRARPHHRHYGRRQPSFAKCMWEKKRCMFAKGARGCNKTLACLYAFQDCMERNHPTRLPTLEETVNRRRHHGPSPLVKICKEQFTNCTAKAGGVCRKQLWCFKKMKSCLMRHHPRVQSIMNKAKNFVKKIKISIKNNLWRKWG